jgi:hypothetical protein
MELHSPYLALEGTFSVAAIFKDQIGYYYFPIPLQIASQGSTEKIGSLYHTTHFKPILRNQVFVYISLFGTRHHLSNHS